MSTQRALLSCHEEKRKRIFGIHFQIKGLRNFYEYWEVLFSLFFGHIRHDLLRDSVCEEPILLNVVLLSAYIV